MPVVQTLHNFRLMCPQATFLRDGQVCEDCLGRAFPWPAIQHRCYRDSVVQTAAVAGTVAFLSIWVAPWAGVVVGLAVSAVVGPSSSPLGLGPSGSLQEAITPPGVVALGLALIACAAFSAPRAVASSRDG